MTLECFNYVYANRTLKLSKEKWCDILKLYIELQQFQQAIFHNPQLYRVLPYLLSSTLKTIATNQDCPSVVFQYLQDHLLSSDCLFWLTLTGTEDIQRDKLNDKIHAYFVLHHILSSYLSHYSLFNSSYLLFFNTLFLSLFLQLPVSASHIKSVLMTYADVLNRDSYLLMNCPQPRKEYTCYIQFIYSILFQGYFVIYYTSLFDYLFNIVITTTDNIIRERVFKADSNQNNESFKLSIMDENNISILRLLVNLPPFTVMGVSLDVGNYDIIVIISASIFYLLCIVKVIIIFLYLHAVHSYSMILCPVIYHLSLVLI